MPRPKTTDKFFMVTTRSERFPTGTRFLGSNNLYKGPGPTTLKDLNEFLEMNGIDPGKVSISKGFMTTISK